MPETLQLAELNLQLDRYPQQNKQSLQAWNAADELLIETASQQQHQIEHILILNDEFGALACAMLSRFPAARISWVNDSTVAQRALKLNLGLNELSADKVQLLAPTEDLPTADLVLMRLPKSLNYLEYQLVQLQAVLSKQRSLIAGAMLKHLSKSVFKLFEQHLGEVSTSLAKKKARLLFGHYQDKQSEQAYPLHWHLAERDWQLQDHANVFCLGKFDIGTRFFLQHLPQGEFEQVIDLGCGNGLLGLAASQAYPEAQLTMVDESLMAVASAEGNMQLNYPEALERSQFVADNCLEQQAANSADLVLCNPPFHQQNTISLHIAEQMFRDAKRCLRKGGLLSIVANRHLAYPPLLKRLFGGYKVSASNNKFVILECTKR